MRSPSTPANETQRMQALLDTGLLDSPSEERFDRLAKLAQQVLRVPIALISLVDADRQWFKSCQGLEVRETGRDVSFCAHAILDGGIFEIPDAHLDERFADNPLVTGAPHIRFYAGAPLSTQEGYRIGTLCVIDNEPRQLTDQERGILRELADCVEAEIQKIDLLRQLQALDMSQKLQDVISLAQSEFIQEDAQRSAFDSLLQGLLDLTNSEYGFIGEVCQRADGQPYLKTYAITNIAWNDETRAFYDAHAPQGMEFTNMNSLFGAAMLTGEPVIANAPSSDPRQCGLPEGHPALDAFLGVPVFHAGEMLAMFGMANRPGGYNEKLLSYLQPLIVTIGQLVSARRIRRKQQQTEMELSRLSRVASETTNGVVITDTEGRVQWINDGFTRITGFQLDDLLGKKPGDVLQGPKTDVQAIATMHEALARCEGFEVELINYTKDGRPYWIRISCTPLRSSQGEVQGFMAIESDISEQRQSEQELRQFKNTLDQTLDCVFMFDAEELRFFYANEGAFRQVGYEKSELFTMHPYDIKSHFTEEKFRAMLAPLISGEQDALTFDTVHRGKQGNMIPVEVFLQYVCPLQERPHFVAIVRDIAERKRIEQALIEQARYTQAIIDNMVDGLITIDGNGIIQSFNRAAQRIFGYTEEEMLGQSVRRLMPKPHADRHDTYLRNHQATGIANIIGKGSEMEGVRKDGTLFPLEIAISQIVHQGKMRYVGLVNDITERKQNEDRLQYLATHDALTGLPNRTLFMDRLSREIARAQRHNSLIGVLLLDLDNFKVVNDSFGHHQGDTLLIELATRLSGSLRDGDTVARLGGDEYVVMMVDIKDEAQVYSAAKRLLKAVSEPVWVNAQEFTPSISIGYCVCPKDATDGATLLRYADAAMYAAKSAGRGTVVAYCDEMDVLSNEHMHILARLKAAIGKGDLKLYYQPQVDTVSGRIIGAEALLRWDDPELGSVSPGRFIPVAEASGLILPLGDWVIDTACRQIAAWNAIGLPLQVSINLSVYQFRQQDLVQRIQSACERHHCPAHLLELEITESAAMQSPELANQQIMALSGAGFSLALDDFGTGYSSLARLGKLQVHKLKIDRSFIVEIPGNPMYEALVRSTISMGAEMGMKLIAEGVETEAQRVFLARHGCTAYQGWLFSKAIPADNFLELVQKVNQQQTSH